MTEITHRIAFGTGKRRQYDRTKALWNLTGSVLSAFVRPHRASLKRLTDMPLTVAGWCFLSTAAFELNTIVGLAASGVCLMLLERQISDDVQ